MVIFPSIEHHDETWICTQESKGKQQFVYKSKRRRKPKPKSRFNSQSAFLAWFGTYLLFFNEDFLTIEEPNDVFIIHVPPVENCFKRKKNVY